MNKTNRKIHAAGKKGVHVWSHASVPDGFYNCNSKYVFDVYVDRGFEAMLGPRGLSLTKRQAANLAYAISVSKPVKVWVTNG